MSDDSLTPPKPTPADWAYLALKATLSLVPCIGGSAAEVFPAIVPPPLQKRQDQWREQVGAAIKKLQESSRVDIDALLQDEGFVTMLIQAQLVALRNHHLEKREALRNAIVNVALSMEGVSDLHLAFVRFVDELSPAHVRLLKAIKDREGEIAHLKTYPDHLSPHLRGRPWANDTRPLQDVLS